VIGGEGGLAQMGGQGLDRLATFRRERSLAVAAVGRRRARRAVAHQQQPALACAVETCHNIFINARYTLRNSL
jgi:hypothetical protein